MEAKLKNAEELDRDLLLKAKEMEFPDKVIGELIGQSEEYVKNLRRQMDIVPAYKLLILVRLSLQQKHHIITLVLEALMK